MSKTKLFSAMRRERAPRSPLVRSSVMLRKNGVFPKGFTMGNSVPKIRIVLFTTSFTRPPSPRGTGIPEIP